MMATTGEKITALLKTNNITQKKLSDDINVTQATISHWINGDVNISQKNMKKMADYFGIDKESLYPDDKLIQKNFNLTYFDSTKDTSNSSEKSSSVQSQLGEQTYYFKLHNDRKKTNDIDIIDDMMQSVKGSVNSSLNFSLSDWGDRIRQKIATMQDEIDKLKEENKKLKDQLEEKTENISSSVTLSKGLTDDSNIDN